MSRGARRDANYGSSSSATANDAPIDRATGAIRQAYEQGLLGEGHLGSGFSFDMEVALTGDSYVAGEETALMEGPSEGKRSIRASGRRPAAGRRGGATEHTSTT